MEAKRGKNEKGVTWGKNVTRAGAQRGKNAAGSNVELLLSAENKST